MVSEYNILNSGLRLCSMSLNIHIALFTCARHAKPLAVETTSSDLEIKFKSVCEALSNLNSPPHQDP